METTPQQTAEGMSLVRVLSGVLDRLVCANAPLALADPGQVTKFHALKAPGIGILQYLERIHKYASCSNECFILALIYIDRLIQRNNFLLTDLNVHRVVITAVLLAAKFFDDAYYNNAYYAKVGGVLVSEMNGLEVDFLFRINFSLHVTPDLFQKYREELLSHSNEVQPIVPTPLMAPPAITPQLPIQGSYHYEDHIYDVTPAMTQPHHDQLNHPHHSQHSSSHYTEKRQASYITPSPPASQSAPPLQPHGLDNPYLQRSNTMPIRRCSPQSYFVVENTMTYPIHSDTMVHHNHAKVDHGFHHEAHQEAAVVWSSGGGAYVDGMSWRDLRDSFPLSM